MQSGKMEISHIFLLSLSIVMAVLVTYITNKKTKGTLIKSQFWIIVLVAPVAIIACYFLGLFVRNYLGSTIKFLLILVPSAVLLFYLEMINPSFLKEYEPLAKEYSGLFMACILAFLITG